LAIQGEIKSVYVAHKDRLCRFGFDLVEQIIVWGVAKLLKTQKGKCTHCGLFFREEDVLEVDHIIPESKGGKDEYKNLQILHRHCHDAKTAKDGLAVKFT
jgi:5-methylcytosine-specific restriction endonuclease McrA